MRVEKANQESIAARLHQEAKVLQGAGKVPDGHEDKEGERANPAGPVGPPGGNCAVPARSQSLLIVRFKQKILQRNSANGDDIGVAVPAHRLRIQYKENTKFVE